MELFQIAANQLEQEYQVFLDYLEVNDVHLAARTSMIGKKDCFAINQKFDIVSERYLSAGRTQEYYTVIDFFYFFSVRSGILQIVPEKRGKRVLRRSDRYYHFMDMLSIERYILMVSVWLGEYQDALDDNGNRYFSVYHLFELMENGEPGRVVRVPYAQEKPAVWGLRYIPEIRMLALFQLIQIEWLKENVEDKENKFRIRELYQTEVGHSFLKLLHKQKKVFWYTLRFDSVLAVVMDMINMHSEDIEMKLSHFWVNPVEAGLNTIEFRVELGSCIRKIKMGDQFNLYDLHYLIQKSVEFDMDHLYCFQIGKGTTMRRYFAPECKDESWTVDTVNLAELSLYEGMSFEYLFDFGDMWRFQVNVYHVLPEHTEECMFERVKGEAPEQ